MSRITKVVSVKAGPKAVLTYIADVKNHPAFISALKSVSNLQGNPRQVGEGWDWTFVIAGIEIKGRAETVGYVEDKRYAFKTTSGIISTFTYSVKPEGSGTQLTADVEYEVPQNILGKIADKAVVERMLDQDGDDAVQNLQAILDN